MTNGNHVVPGAGPVFTEASDPAPELRELAGRLHASGLIPRGLTCCVWIVRPDGHIGYVSNGPRDRVITMLKEWLKDQGELS